TRGMHLANLVSRNDSEPKLPSYGDGVIRGETMEIGELVAVAVEAPHSKEGCPFCRPKEAVSKENALNADQDEDANPENDTFNASGTLAKNLAKRPQASEVPAIPKREKAPVHTMEMASAPGRTWHKRVYEAGQIP